MTAYLNGEFLALDQCHINPLDRGFLFGDGVYEVLPVRDGKVFLLKQHLQRLSYSLEQVGIKNPHSNSQWQALIEQLIDSSDTPDIGVYLHITRGIATSRNHVASEAIPPTVFMMLIEVSKDTQSITDAGVSAITVEDMRWGRCDIKATNLLANVMMRNQASLSGAFEAIIIRQGLLLEGAASNVFVIKNGEIATPELGHHILPGITRETVLHIANRDAIGCTERAINEDELLTSDEVWLSSSTKNILPVTKINETLIGNGAPGPIWKQMSQKIETYSDQ